MQTPYDWITVAIFAGLIVVFLQRSVDESQADDSILTNLPPSIGCAVANYLGNEGYVGGAVLGIVAVLAYIYFFIKPFGIGPR